MLLLPAFGLLLCGFAGVIVNGILAYRFRADPAAARETIRSQLSSLRPLGLGADDPPADREKLDVQRAEQTVRIMKWVSPLFAGVSAVVLLGGLSIALGWNYRLAQLSCVAASVNIPQFCCVPGAIAGLWGLVLLRSAEGRAHFGQ
jgi:hypothetical protein